MAPKVKCKWTTGVCPGRGNGFKLETHYKGRHLEIVGGIDIRRRGEHAFYLAYVDGVCIGSPGSKSEAHELFYYHINEGFGKKDSK